MELVSVVTIENSKKCLMDNYSFNFNFWASQKTVMSWKQNIPQCVIPKKKKTFSNLPAFFSVLSV